MNLVSRRLLLQLPRRLPPGVAPSRPPHFSTMVNLETPKVRQKREEHLGAALRIVKAYATGRFDESVDIAIKLNVDAKRSDERVRGTAELPHGTGRTVRVAVFARGDLAAGVRPRDVRQRTLWRRSSREGLTLSAAWRRRRCCRCLRARRVLGPRNLMPNPKRGTVTTAVADAVRRAKGGEVQFRANPHAIVHSSIGRMSFPQEHLVENGLVMLRSVLAQRPDRFRGKPPTSLHLLSTGGPGVQLDHRLW